MKLIFRIHLVFVFTLRVSFQLMTKHLPNLDEVSFPDGSIPQHSFQGAKVVRQLTDLLTQILQSALDLLLFLHLLAQPLHFLLMLPARLFFCLSGSLFLLTGTIGLFAALWFTKKIYGSIKVD